MFPFFRTLPEMQGLQRSPTLPTLDGHSPCQFLRDGPVLRLVVTKTGPLMRNDSMPLNFYRKFSTALLGVAALVSTAAAQDIPAPPPAGVPGVRVPSRPVVVPNVTPVDESNSLPTLPDNPIQLETNLPSSAKPTTVAPSAAPQPVQPTPVVSGVPAKIVGPVYYYAPGPNNAPWNRMAPPPMPVPNSPFVEDLSVAGDHGRYPYYSYRRPWYTPGQMNANVTIVW